MRFQLDVDGDEEARNELNRRAGRAQHMKPALERVLGVIVARYRRRFQGGEWKPLASATVERKSRQGLDPRVMRASGALERALTAPGRTAGRTQSVGKTQARVGVGKKLFYARFQHFGTESIPARPLFRWERDDERRALEILDRHLFG